MPKRVPAPNTLERGSPYRAANPGGGAVNRARHMRLLMQTRATRPA